VQQIPVKRLHIAGEDRRFMQPGVSETSPPTRKRRNFGSGVVAAVTNPAAEEEVLRRGSAYAACEGGAADGPSGWMQPASGETASSASSESIHSEVQSARAKFFCAAKPRHGSMTKRAPWD